MYTHTEQEFTERWDAIKQKYEDHLEFPTYYLEDEIISSHRHKLIRCYTNQITHFGNTSTSRAERHPAKLKADPVSSIGINTFNF